MKDPCLERLEAAWEELKLEKKWKSLGKCLRSILNLHKSSESLKESEKDLNDRVQFLEASLPEMDFKEAVQVIGDIRHVRKHAKLASSDQYGVALRQRLDKKTRSKIRKRNRAPVLSPKDGFQYREVLAGTADLNGFFSDRMGDADS